MCPPLVYGPPKLFSLFLLVIYSQRQKVETHWGLHTYFQNHHRHLSFKFSLRLNPNL